MDSEPVGDRSIDRYAATFVQWAAGDDTASTPDDGEHRVSRAGLPDRLLSIRRVVSDGVTALEAATRDESIDEATGAPTVWTTTLRVVLAPDADHVCLENAMESDNISLRPKVGRPRVIDRLLGAAGKATLGRSAVLAAPVPVEAGHVSVLTAMLRDPDRALPVIVFSEPAHSSSTRWLELAERTASRASGVAVVITLDAAAVTEFRHQLGTLAVWGGAVRTYVPGPVENDADAWRHRFMTGDLVARLDGGTVDRLVYNAAQLSTRRRVPGVFDVLAATTADSVSVAEVEAEREQWAFELELEQEERARVEGELTRALGHLARLRDRLDSEGHGSLFWESQSTDDPDATPDSVQDTSDAVLTAQQHLADWVAIPDSAPRELDGIDSGPNALSWGNATWRGLRALAAYARARADGFQGHFWDWCARGEPLAWPATTKKLAMSESETVVNNDRFASMRVFEVDLSVDPAGRIMMQSHLKISEGGGNLAPRVYFHDDTGGATRKVHVGFVGPHYLVPNTRS
ncbi:MAG: hypothetical protein NVV70_03725 [Cellulomonas sp.]|nr:hypothetical protein [Cellulomonas sp.]MCR6647277.1 hypothetical protein [Cellulomonas sp.]